MTCARPAATGCLELDQLTTASPVISAGTAEACATVHRAMEGGCTAYGHRYRTLGGADGETLYVSQPADALRPLPSQASVRRRREIS